MAPDGLFYFWLVEAVCLAVTFRFSNKFLFLYFYLRRSRQDLELLLLLLLGWLLLLGGAVCMSPSTILTSAL